jgi:hypothetical protein
MKNVLKLSIGLIIFFTKIQVSDAQSIDFDTPNNNLTPWHQHFDATLPLDGNERQVGVVSATPSGFSWNVSMVSPVAHSEQPVENNGNAVTFEGLRFRIHEGAFTISNVAGIAERSYIVVVKAIRQSDNNIQERRYEIIVRKPIQMIFALDRSGSMECVGSPVFNWPVCTTNFINGDRRWHKLKSAMRKFVDKMNTSPTTGPFILGSDQFKVIYFSGIVNTATGGVGSFQTIGNFAMNINTSMLSQENESPLARDGTSYGSAILKALTTSEGFNNANAKKIFILFTDGDQNISPKVQVTGQTLDDATDFSNRGIQIFTIGIGLIPSETTAILANIPPANGGTYSAPVLANDDQITAFSNQMFTAIFQGSSPQQIESERFALGETPTARTFPVNKDVTRLYLEAVFDKPIGESYRYRVEHDGVDVTSKARVTKDNFFATLLLDFQNDSLKLKSEGKWTLTAIPRSESTGQGSFVRLSATADEHTLKFKCDAGQKYFEECDLITPSVRLTEAGQAISNATVTATIYEPGKDIGDLLARTPAPSIPPASTSLDAGSCALQKYNALKISNPALIQSYENYQPTTINLTHTGNGLYTAAGYKTKVPGVYKVVYKADATTTKLGEIQRMEEQTINVRFPSLSYDLVRSKPVSSFGDNNFYRFTVTVQPSFKDCSGATKYVGPGWENSFKVTGTGINSQGVTVEDGCDDGKYKISFSTRNRNPITNITLVDEPIYDGYIRDFDKPYTPQKWEVKLIVAATYPLNSLGALYKTALLGKIGLNRRLNYRTSVGIEAGHYRFRDNFAITGGTLGGDVVVASTSNGGTPIEVSLGGGVGVFKPYNLNAEFGGTGRATMAIEWLNPRTHFLVELAYYKLASSGYDFYTGGIGLRYKF